MDLSIELEVFTYSVPGFAEPMRWNVSLAKRLCDASPAAAIVATLEVPRDEMQRIIASNDIYPEKLAALVDRERPGIAAPAFFDGRIVYCLIDGTHRCKAAYDAERPFFARLLTDDVAKLCLISSPKELLAWLK